VIFVNKQINKIILIIIAIRHFKAKHLGDGVNWEILQFLWSLVFLQAKEVFQLCLGYQVTATGFNLSKSQLSLFKNLKLSGVIPVTHYNSSQFVYRNVYKHGQSLSGARGANSFLMILSNE